MERIYFRNLYRAGGSIGITLPKSFCDRLLLDEKTKIAIIEKESEITIKCIDEEILEIVKKQYDVNYLMSGEMKVTKVDQEKKNISINKKLRGKVEWKKPKFKKG